MSARRDWLTWRVVYVAIFVVVFLLIGALVVLSQTEPSRSDRQYVQVVDGQLVCPSEEES